ncbi:TonB-dependent siderophore receptor [Sphingomonas sp. SCN 67-18]|uniref:TonB-dependent receptor plug domain-containing protein n=1 Tax=uncultured Sphingomonas sp. TaxID=158754 RepID=UPI000A67B2D2|nr:TonB-dependent receptor [Sphingomonas sp. SCN 67-18]
MSLSMAIMSLLSSASAAAVVQPMEPADALQPDPVMQDQAVADAGAAGEGAAGQSGDIVVTGSRIVRDGTRAPTPLTVVSSESLAANSPQGIAEGLNQLPIFQGAINAQMTQLVSSNRVRSGNYMNLRYLGPTRVLVLQDGYRLPPSGNNGGVDTNIIPQLLIERVEVVTGGASAVYGSDAVSGVVNYIIDKRFTGIKTLAQAGISHYGDAFSYRLGAAAGAAMLDNRLNIQLSAEYYLNEGIPRRNRGADELWMNGSVDTTLASGAPGSKNNPFIDYPNVYRNTTSKGGLIFAGPAGFVNMQFLPSGALAPFDLGTPIGRPGFGQGGDAPAQCSECYLVPKSSTAQLFGRMTYDFGSDTVGFIQASLNEAKNYGENVYATSGDVFIYADNYYLNQQLTPAQLTALGGQRLSLRRNFGEWDTQADRLGVIASNQNLKSFVINGGLSGGLFGDWKWDTAVTYGLTDFKSTTYDEIRSDRLLAAIDVVAGPGGAPVCRVTQVSTRFPDCKPLNILGEGRSDPAARQWVMEDSKWGVKNHLYFGSLNFTGPLFSTWAGPVSLAFGAEYRKQKLIQTSNSDPGVPVDFTGIRGGNGGVFRGTNVGVANGAYNVKELYAETVIPLVKDASFTDSLEINAAFRHADYSTSGGVNTWKIGTTWEPISDIIVRAALSQDIRAPSLIELYGAVTVQERSVFDPVTNAIHTVRNPSGGNLNLRPEKADTLTMGVVLKPSFAPGLYGSIDYFDIRINDAIGTPGTILQIFDACTANQASPLCNLIIRDASNNPVEISGMNENVAVVSTKGIDFEFGYRAPVFDGNLSVRLLGTRLTSYKRQDTNAVPIVEYVGTADLPGLLTSVYPLPKWRGNLDVSYSTDSFTIGVQQRMIGSYIKSRGLQHWVDNSIGKVFYTDLNFSTNVEAFGGQSQFFITVNNAFNRKGPFFVTDQFPGSQPPTARTMYDIMGRYVTVGIRGRF